MTNSTSDGKFRFKRVNPENKDVRETLRSLHWLCFFSSAPFPKWEGGAWWIVYQGGAPVAFTGIREGTNNPNMGYLERSGVLPSARGHKLQRRMVKVREQYARKQGWDGLVTDTLDNPASANNLIATGFTTFSPERRWGFNEAVYWKKVFNAAS